MSFILPQEIGYLIFIGGGLITTVLVLLLILVDTNGLEHTFTEFLYIRLGKFGHKVFLIFALLTNSIVTARLVFGGAVA